MLLSALLLWESTEAAVAVFLLELQIVVEWSAAEVLALACSCAGLELRKEVELQPLKRSAARPGRRKLSAFGRGCTSPNWGADSRLLWTDFELQTVKPPRAIPTGLYDPQQPTTPPHAFLSTPDSQCALLRTSVEAAAVPPPACMASQSPRDVVVIPVRLFPSSEGLPSRRIG
jgi:hypothetical protein